MSRLGAGYGYSTVFPVEDDFLTTDVLWYLADNLGTLRDLAVASIDGNGYVTDVVIEEHYNFDAFGNVLLGDTSKTHYTFRVSKLNRREPSARGKLPDAVQF
jgi:hypothetical protein